ncbi:hypothetical protein BZG01_14845 [Labilibaculum manganireducens]|uniref:Phage Gp37/Gp68 family protein n=1 Tax=Labilibaculum manganireducens TaxID=1940525 RepID=A0A2N3I1M6_9BACT|nr:DUF5131 family protein [Labilibaculum manganireducens]PKQ64153.1 hypothetical protein BZG01_14845 [Labilibaculum manganireducens]
MHDIWNPWHGCTKISEGCQHCYMFFLDRTRNKDGSDIYKTKSGFSYPLHKDRKGNYKIKSGELIRVCMTSDFFLAEADEWRNEAWNMMHQRSDVKFFLLTKRPERIKECLPKNWGDGWENIFLNVSCENQRRADERIPILLNLPFKHKGIMTAPLIGSIRIENYLKTGQIEQLIAGGENYDGARPCDFEWIKSLQQQCVNQNVSFCFIETGSRFIKDGKIFSLPKKTIQSQMAFKSGVNFSGKAIEFILKDRMGFTIEKSQQYRPQYKKHCEICGSKPICNGCSNCGKCN